MNPGGGSPATAALLQRYLRPLLSAGADTIVLGCTHYPFLASQIQQIAGPDVAIVDAALNVCGRRM